jgi:hypothetical protein
MEIHLYRFILPIYASFPQKGFYNNKALIPDGGIVRLSNRRGEGHGRTECKAN